MDKYAILLGYFVKQYGIIERLYNEVVKLDLATWENGYVFALKVQQLFTALEDLLKQIAKAFENHIEELGSFHRELLLRMNISIPHMHPAVLSNESFILLDKIRAFRHFILHGYGCELDEQALKALQNLLISGFGTVETDFSTFRKYIETLS